MREKHVSTLHRNTRHDVGRQRDEEALAGSGGHACLVHVDLRGLSSRLGQCLIDAELSNCNQIRTLCSRTNFSL